MRLYAKTEKLIIECAIGRNVATVNAQFAMQFHRIL